MVSSFSLSLLGQETRSDHLSFFDASLGSHHPVDYVGFDPLDQAIQVGPDQDQEDPLVISFTLEPPEHH